MKIEINTDYEHPSDMRLLSEFLLKVADNQQKLREQRADSATVYAAGVLGGAAANQQAAVATNTVVKSRKGKKDEPVSDTGNGGAVSSTTTTADSAASASGDAGNVSGAAAPTEQAPAAPAASTSEPTTAPSDPAKLRTEIRSVLTPLMTSDKAIKVQELIAQFGGSVSKCADEDLAALLAKAKVLA